MKKHFNLILLIITVLLLGSNFYFSYQINSNLKATKKELKESQEQLDLKVQEIVDLKSQFSTDKDFMLNEIKAIINVSKESHKKTYILYSDKLIEKWTKTLAEVPKYSSKSKASKIAQEQFNRLMAKENLYNQEMIENLKSVDKNKQ